jgi:chaperonin GroES
MNKEIKPLYDRVLIERVEESTKTASGLYIPPTAQEKAQVGKVVAIGNGRMTANGTLVPLTVKVGDLVFFGKYAGTDLSGVSLGAVADTIDNRLIIKEDEILGIIGQ